MPTPLSRVDVYTRTAAASAELQAPQRGLSVTQRRILALLEQPRSFADIVSAMHGDDARAERDIARLVELELVRSASRAAASPDAVPPAVPRIVPARIARPMSRATLRRRSPARGVAAGVLVAGVIGIAMAIAWPSGEPATIEHGNGANATAAATTAIGTVMPAPPVQPAAITPNVSPIGTAGMGAAAQAQPYGGVLEPASTERPPQKALSRPERSSPVTAARSEAPISQAATIAGAGAAAVPNPADSKIARSAVAGTSAANASPADERAAYVTAASTSAANTSAANTSAANTSVANTRADNSNPRGAGTNVAVANPAGSSGTDTVAGGVRPTAQTIPAAMHIVAVDATPARQPTAAASEPPPAPVLVARAPATTLPSVAKPRLAPIVREEPEFPREALLSKIAGGRVVARLSIDRDGHVAHVEIVSSQPPRVFDRSVNRALARWRFEPSDNPRSTDVEVDFRAN
jgi:TonB family protein